MSMSKIKNANTPTPQHSNTRTLFSLEHLLREESLPGNTQALQHCIPDYLVCNRYAINLIYNVHASEKPPKQNYCDTRDVYR